MLRCFGGQSTSSLRGQNIPSAFQEREGDAALEGDAGERGVQQLRWDALGAAADAGRHPGHRRAVRQLCVQARLHDRRNL